MTATHIRLIVLAAAGALALVSCQTTQGIGRDIERAGQRLENAASR